METLGSLLDRQTSATSAVPARRSVLIATDDDSSLFKAIELEAALFQWSVWLCNDLGRLPDLLADSQARVVLVDYQSSCADRRPDLLDDLMKDPFPCVVASDGPLPTVSTPAAWVSKQDPYEVFVEVLRSQTAPGLDNPPAILVVDADPIVLDLVSHALCDVDMAVDTLPDGLGFWDALDSRRPDLVVLAVDLPHLGGLELCRAMRCDERYRAIPVIFLSSYPDSYTLRRAFEAGGDDYLLKPVSLSELRSRVSHRLERARCSTYRGGYAPSRKIHSSLHQIMLRAARECLSVAFVVVHTHSPEPLDMIRQRLRLNLRAEDVIRKVGESELIVAMLGVQRKRALGRIGDALGDWSDQASIGAARYPQDGDELEQVLLKARESIRPLSTNKVLQQAPQMLAVSL